MNANINTGFETETELENQFDALVLVGPNDLEISYECIKGILKFTKCQKVYVITKMVLSSIILSKFSLENKIVIVDEDSSILPFSYPDVFQIIEKLQNISVKHNQPDRSRWIWQQLVKLYSNHITQKRYVLIVDADTIFLNHVSFFTTDSSNTFENTTQTLINTGTEYHTPYFEHIKRLTTLDKSVNFSAITHHMMFDHTIIDKMKTHVESKFNKLFWVAFLEQLDANEINCSACSEYELYYTFANAYHNNQIQIRNLQWCNMDNSEKATLLSKQNEKFDYISAHHYLRKTITR